MAAILGSECHHAAAIEFRGQASTSANFKNNAHESAMGVGFAEVAEILEQEIDQAKPTRFARKCSGHVSLVRSAIGSARDREFEHDVPN
ncbi:MAG: hypothetical protein ACM3JB_10925, partial [Acidobacteriaceae bacterium]